MIIVSTIPATDGQTYTLTLQKNIAPEQQDAHTDIEPEQIGRTH